MTKLAPRKAAKRGHTEGAEIRQPAKKSSKKHIQRKQEISSRWKIGLVIVVLCLLIGTIVVYFSPFTQTGPRGKVSQGRNDDQNKRAKKSKDDPREDQKQKSRGKIFFRIQRFIINAVFCVVG